MKTKDEIIGKVREIQGFCEMFLRDFSDEAYMESYPWVMDIEDNADELKKLLRPLVRKEIKKNNYTQEYIECLVGYIDI